MRVAEFGYRTIIVDRPLRARWEIGATTWDGLAEDKALAKLDGGSVDVVVGELLSFAPGPFADEDECRELLSDVLAEAGMSKPPAPLLKALVARCVIRDAEAEPIRDSKGRLVADSDLRDTENVPLNEDVGEYLAREVLPHVPDAWVADKTGKVGYEIPFTRLFYRYTPPRPSAEIKAELREREMRIRQLLEDVLV